MSDATPIQRSVTANYTPLPEGVAGAPGAALAAAGDALAQFGAVQAQAQQKADLIKARLSARQQIDTLTDTFRTDTDPDTMAQRFSDAATKIGATVGGNLQGDAAAQFTDEFGVLSEASLRGVKDMAFNRQQNQVGATIDQGAEVNGRAAAYATNQVDRSVALNAQAKSIKDAVAGGMLTPELGERKLQTFKEQVSFYDGKRDVFNNPAAALKKLGDTQNYLPDLDPLKRQELQQEAVSNIRQREREAKEGLALARLGAEQAASDLHDVIVSGQPVAQSVVDIAQQSALASKDPRAISRVVGLMRAKGFADGMRGANPREVDAGISALEQQAQAHGADPAMADALTAARKFKETMTTGLTHDPLAWAAGQGVVALQPLLLNGSDAPAAFQGRVRQAQIVSQRYGVPFDPLTAAETETLKTRLDASQAPEMRLATLKGLVNGFGANAAPVLAKVGAADPAVAQAGALVASGHAFEGAARDVLTGSSLLRDKTNSGLKPGASALSVTKTPQLLAAYAMLPEQQTRVLAAADAIYATRAARQGLTGGDVAGGSAGRQIYSRALQEAAGARFDGDGTQWGGLSTYRGGSVIVPPTLQADGFEDMVHHLQVRDLTAASLNRAAPAWNGGEAPGNLIHRTWLVSMGNGAYGLSTTNPANGAITPLLDARGGRFRFNFNTALTSLQARQARDQGRPVDPIAGGN